MDGHGTHTLSIAGGNFVRNVSVLNNGNGTAKGGSPRARLAVYKVCWGHHSSEDCIDEDILSAFDQAIEDGVDILSVSIGKTFVPKPYEMLTNAMSIGSFHAILKGIIVVASAGNEGPKLQTVCNVAPWIFTVASGSIDRDFSNNITLGNGQIIKVGVISFISLFHIYYYIMTFAINYILLQMFPKSLLDYIKECSLIIGYI